MSGYFILFAASFLAATILPFYSEVVLFTMIGQGFPAGNVVLVATAGNTLGAVVNWVLGRFLLRFRDRRWFFFRDKDLEKSQQWFNRYGVWSLLLAWMPVGGDALTFVAGVMRVSLWKFLILVSIGKMLRYIFVVFFADWVTGMSF